jgi:hypothetical protein
MTIDPAPTPDEIAAIIGALASVASSESKHAASAKTPPWRLASREYASDFRPLGRLR